MTKSKYKYICEVCKEAPLRNGFRRSYRWKTERGFKNHRCYADELKEMERRVKEKERRLYERVKNSKYKIGDEVPYVGYSVLKPTHVWRGDRRVRMRYEEKRRYYALHGKIQEITLWGYIVDGVHVYDNDIYPTIKEAEKAAEKAQKGYDEHCRHAVRCR